MDWRPYLTHGVAEQRYIVFFTMYDISRVRTLYHIIEIDYSYPYIHLLTTLRHGYGPDQGYYGIGQFRDLGILFWDRVE